MTFYLCPYRAAMVCCLISLNNSLGCQQIAVIQSETHDFRLPFLFPLFSLLFSPHPSPPSPSFWPLPAADKLIASNIACEKSKGAGPSAKSLALSLPLSLPLPHSLSLYLLPHLTPTRSMRSNFLSISIWIVAFCFLFLFIFFYLCFFFFLCFFLNWLWLHFEQRGSGK